MRQKRSEGESAPMTLGQALAAKVAADRLVQDVPTSGRARHRRSRRAPRAAAGATEGPAAVVTLRLCADLPGMRASAASLRVFVKQPEDAPDYDAGNDRNG